MKKLMLIGKTGVGKTSLTQRINGESYTYEKTQSLNFSGQIIDTPGEYIENKRYYTALITTACDADVIALVQDVSEEQSLFPPAFSKIFDKEVIGIITKVDVESADLNKAKEFLEEAGVEKIFYISSETQKGISELINYLDSGELN